ncbi:MAG: transposase, partial [Gemmatimonadaceae bacterium]|nr:transposase [Gemmatimonadaceae bacterium]
AWTAGLRTRVDAWGPPPLERMTNLFFEMNAYDIKTRIADEGRIPLVPLVHAHELTRGGLVATRDGLPDGDTKIVFDRFHIMREMTKAVDTVRKQEHRAFLRDGDDSPLTGSKYLWLFSDERRPERHADAFATLQALNLKVGRAWAIKEALRTLWTYRQHAAVTRFFTRRYGWAVRCRHAEASSRWHPALRQASDHEWRGRGSQQQNHEHHTQGR